jgi:proteasome lid subunit RPN8/RPN11
MSDSLQNENLEEETSSPDDPALPLRQESSDVPAPALEPADAEAAEEEEPDFELEVELVEEELPAGEDPASRENMELLPLGSPLSAPRWIVGFSCLKQILAHGERHACMEVGGVLLGDIWRCEAGRVTEVREALPAMHTEAGMGHVTFSHETWAEIYDYLEHWAEGLKIVGWYHSHPGFGAFFSGQDRFIQKNFFSSPGQVGIVVDPHRKELAAFESETGEVEELTGLWLMALTENAAAARDLSSQLTFPAGSNKPRGLWQKLKHLVKPPDST